MIRKDTDSSSAAEQAVLEFIATNDLVWNIVEDKLFKKLKTVFILAGPMYKSPEKHDIGMSHNKIGKILSGGLQISQVSKSEMGTYYAQMAPSTGKEPH